jgi:acyl carrier protein
MNEKIFIETLQSSLEIEGREIQMTDEFRKYPEWDSLAQLTMIAMLDEEFGITIEMKRFNELATVKDLFEAVKTALGEE